MSKGSKWIRRCVGMIAAFCAMPTFAAWTLNLREGVTPVSRDVYFLHMTIFWICVGIGIIVFGVLIYALIYHRKSRGAIPSKFHEHPGLELLWAVVPFIILVIMAIPATKVLIDMDDASDADITIKVTGFQWKWQYQYLDQGIKFFSVLATPRDQYHGNAKKNEWYLLEVDKPVVLPINKKIRFLVTSNDVIHSWWVPDLAVKRDAMPGFIGEAWARIDKVGTYRGQCAELCGMNHGFMPIVIEAVEPEKFQQWVDAQVAEKLKDEAANVKPMTKDELLRDGQKVYEKICAVCHKVDGTGTPPAFPPLKGSSIAVGKPISRHIDRVLNGVKGTAMQAFRDQLSDTEIASVITYERNAFGNNTGDLVQPSDVKAGRAVQVTENSAKEKK